MPHFILLVLVKNSDLFQNSAPVKQMFFIELKALKGRNEILPT